MSKRVYVTGTESTGKSVLSEQLAAHFQTAFVPEYARQWMTENGKQFTRDDVVHIAAKQLALEEKMMRKANKILICDTDFFNFKIWLEFNNWDVPEFITHAINERQGDLYLLCDIDLPWQTDGYRSLEIHRGYLQQQFLHHLQQYDCTYNIVRGMGAARLQCAVAAVKHWL